MLSVEPGKLLRARLRLEYIPIGSDVACHGETGQPELALHHAGISCSQRLGKNHVVDRDELRGSKVWCSVTVLQVLQRFLVSDAGQG